MAFAVDIRHWESVAAFESHLAQYDPQIAPWVRGLTYHHTYIPNRNQWRGQQSVEGLARYYATQAPWRDAQGRARYGWSAGPHLFVAEDGIWQLTPLNEPGIHAVSFNATHWGMEVVGYYDHEVWPAHTQELAYGAGAALLRWRDLPVSSVNGHRDDPLTTKSCPGRMINLDHIRRDLAALLATQTAPTPVAPATGLITADSSIFGPPSATPEQAVAAILTRKPDASYTPYDVRSIVGSYWQVCLPVNVNPVIAIAQMMHETGTLTEPPSLRPRRNPAGIGITADGVPGVSFLNWQQSVIGQVGRLLAYCTSLAERTPAEHDLIAAALAYRDLPPRIQNSATCLRQLGQVHNPSGSGWAKPGDNYGNKLAEYANAIGATKG